MKRIAVTAAASAALVLGSIGGAFAAGMTGSSGYSGSTQPTMSVGDSSGGSIDASGKSYTHALNLLEANGYTGIENFARSGQTFTATALHNGKRVQVAVEPSGQIRPQG